MFLLLLLSLSLSPLPSPWGVGAVVGQESGQGGRFSSPGRPRGTLGPAAVAIASQRSWSCSRGRPTWWFPGRWVPREPFLQGQPRRAPSIFAAFPCLCQSTFCSKEGAPLGARRIVVPSGWVSASTRGSEGLSVRSRKAEVCSLSMVGGGSASHKIPKWGEAVPQTQQGVQMLGHQRE